VATLPDATPPLLDGVRHQPLAPVLAEPGAFFAAGNYDAVIALNYPELAPHVKLASPLTLNIAWLHIYPDQPALKDLPRLSPMLDAIVYVSRTQHAAFDLATPSAVIGNAIAPAFENLFGSAGELLQAKRNLAAYTSMPFRGLNILVDAMAHAKTATELDIYSSMRAYQAAERNFTALYEAAVRNPRIRYHGAIGQDELARRLRPVAFLAYPSSFIETYCIAAQEALAAGLKVIANDLGALPETTLGYADLLPVGGGSLAREDQVRGFARLREKNETEFLRDPDAWAERRFAQVMAVNRLCTWQVRAREWENFLAPAVAARRG